MQALNLKSVGTTLALTSLLVGSGFFNVQGAHAQDAKEPFISTIECDKIVAGVQSQIVPIKDELSPVFRASIKSFVTTDLDCSGNRKIIIVTEGDKAAFSMFKTVLAQATPPFNIDIEKFGIVPVRSKIEK